MCYVEVVYEDAATGARLVRSTDQLVWYRADGYPVQGFLLQRALERRWKQSDECARWVFDGVRPDTQAAPDTDEATAEEDAAASIRIAV